LLNTERRKRKGKTGKREGKVKNEGLATCQIEERSEQRELQGEKFIRGMTWV